MQTPTFGTFNTQMILDMTTGAMIQELAALLAKMYENSTERVEMQNNLNEGTYGSFAEMIGNMRVMDAEQKQMGKRAKLLAANIWGMDFMDVVRDAVQFGLVPPLETVKDITQAKSAIVILAAKNGKGTGKIVATV